MRINHLLAETQEVVYISFWGDTIWIVDGVYQVYLFYRKEAPPLSIASISTCSKYLEDGFEKRAGASQNSRNTA